MKKFWAEFKKFISKGNIIDLAIAVILGSAFNKIVSSLVNDIIMPLISCAVGGADVSDWKWVIKPAVYDANGNVIVSESAFKYGSFIQTIIDFLIIAFTLFLIFKIFNYSKNKLNQLGDTIVTETKKYKDKKKKRKNKNGEIETTEVLVETTSAGESPDGVQFQEQKAEKDTNKETLDTPLEEKKPAEELAKDTNTPNSNKEDEMIKLLSEIRDSLQPKKDK